MHRISKIIRRSISSVYVSPTLSHCSEKVEITGDGYDANTPLTIQGCLVCPEEDFNFQSYAHIYTNKNGCFNLKTTESIAGTYTGFNQMGMFWSMVAQGKPQRTIFANGLQNLSYKFNVFDGHTIDFDFQPLSSIVCGRYLTKDVQRIPVVEDNLRGTLFLPMGNGPFPCVVTLYGVMKKDRVPEQMAAYLSHQGFATLALGYFGMEALPKTYTASPLRVEYFENALEYLRQRKEIDPERMGVFGESKGGEIAIAMMSHLTGIKAVCTVNGSICSMGTSTTYKNKTTDMIGMSSERVKFIDSNTMNVIDVLNNPLHEPNSIHPIENSTADLLMIAGERDLNFKSDLFTDIAKERMDKAGKRNYRIVKLTEFGHLLDIPFMPLCLKGGHPLAPKGMFFDFGGGDNKDENINQQVEAWQKIIEFFNDTLKVTKSRL